MGVWFLGRGDDLRIEGIPNGRQIKFKADFWEGRLWKAKYFGMISGSKSSSSFRAAVKASAVRAAMADVFNALLWVARSGARWRDLPERFGPYQTAKRRYYRWIEMGVFDRLFEARRQPA